MKRSPRHMSWLCPVMLAIGWVAGATIRPIGGEPPVNAAPPAKAPAAPWLKGAPEEKLAQLEPHLRGLDLCMVEVDHRFIELCFAGQDRNWDYAKYQAEKMALTMRLGLERRPKRAESARPFLEEDLPIVWRAAEARDAAAFDAALDRLRRACMTCHTKEQVPYFTVERPEQRRSSIRRVE